MSKFFMVTLLSCILGALTSCIHAQIIIKDFDKRGKQLRTVQQTVTVVEGKRVPYVADITKLKRFDRLSTEEKKTLEEDLIPDTLSVKNIQRQNKVLLRNPEPLEIYRKRWSLPVEKENERE